MSDSRVKRARTFARAIKMNTVSNAKIAPRVRRAGKAANK